MTLIPYNSLRNIANSLARTQNGTAAIVIVQKEDGTINIGTEGFSPSDLRHALNVANCYSFTFEGWNCEAEDPTVA